MRHGGGQAASGKSQRSAIWLLALTSFVAGCIAIPLGSDPSVDVTLIDAATHQPIANRDVTVASVTEPDRVARSTTDATGHLRVGGIIRHYKCTIGEACESELSGGSSVRISASGYVTKDFTVTPYQLTHSSIPLAGAIELAPAKRD